MCIFTGTAFSLYQIKSQGAGANFIRLVVKTIGYGISI